MPNFTGLFSRFRKPAVGAIPRSNAVRLNTANANLERNMKAYVNSYLENRNSPNKVPVLNKKLVNNLHRFINAKRARVAGAAAGAVATAPSSVQTAAANAAVQTHPTSPPANVGANVGKAVNNAGGNVAQAANAAAAAAAEASRQQNKSPNVVANNAANAAAKAAKNAAPKNTPPALLAITAGNAAANAVPNNKKIVAAANAAANAARNQAMSQGQGSNQANAEAAKAAAKAAVSAASNNTPPSAVANAAANAVLNAGGNNNAAANAAANAAKNQAKNQGKNNAAANNAAAAAAAAVQPGETGAAAPLELNINVPGSNTKVKVKRNNVGSNWRFANSVNNARYNLNNRNKNVPIIRNIGAGNLFKQAQAQRPTPKVNNRNVNAIRAKLNGPNMPPGNWYRYAASLGYNTGKYANEANRLFTSGNKKALSTFILKSLMTVHPNKGNRSNAKNQQIRNLLTRNLTKARENLAKN